MTAWNEQLRQRRLRRGLTQEELATELARVAWEQNRERIGVDAAMVSKWERGKKQPSNSYRRLLAAVFAADPLSFDEPSEDLQRLGLEYTPSIPDTLEAVDKLGHADIKRRTFLKTALFAVAASIGPSRDWLLATLEEATSPARKVSSDQVEAIRRTFGVFQELDVMRGGGHARQQLAAYLTSTVTPLLRSNDASTGAGQALYEAGAEQLYLIGWMAFDDGEHVLAQRYLIQALRLSHEARSPELGAHVLAGLSDQATLTGHPDQGLQLARAGRAGLRQGHSPACCADLWALQARAEAALGDGKAAAHSVLESQRAADDIHLADEPEWARFIDAAYLNGEYGHAFRDLDEPEEAARFAARSAAEAGRQSRARRGSLAHATLARAALSNHDLEAAATEAASTVRLAATVRSSRSADAVGDLRNRLSPHQDSRPVADFFDLANSLLPA
jgi:transcriptional regulator with XRE-family HTH domain